MHASNGRIGHRPIIARVSLRLALRLIERILRLASPALFPMPGGQQGAAGQQDGKPA